MAQRVKHLSAMQETWVRSLGVDGITNSMDVGLGELQELVMDGGPGILQSMGSQRVRHD